MPASNKPDEHENKPATTPATSSPSPDDQSPVSQAAPAEPSRRGRTACPECGSAVEVYEGDNPHKQHTGICPKHGRVTL